MYLQIVGERELDPLLQVDVEADGLRLVLNCQDPHPTVASGQLYSFSSLFYIILCIVVDNVSAGSGINWAPGSESMIMNYGSGSESLQFVKDSKKFQEKRSIFIQLNDLITYLTT